MSQGLSSYIPSLSLDDESRDVDEMISLTSQNDVQEFRSVSPDSMSMRSMDTCCTDVEPTERGRMDVRVVPAQMHRSNSLLDSIMTAYDMHRLPRGLAIIIDIEIYENDIQERRFGSHVDVENLTQLLKGLSFDVTVHRNLQQALFYKVITEFRSNKMHHESDMAIVVILSHGKDGVVYAADGQSIDMEFIYEFFNNRNCPALQGKPKFFIVQACRGDRPDQGVEGEGATSVAKRKRPEGLDRIPTLSEKGDVFRARPTWEDMIIAYSTIPGYASLRDHERGTWFIQSLVEVFMNHAHNTELVDLLRMTSERLSHFTNEQGEKQTCNVEMRHLYKRIYFNPGLGRPPAPAVSRSLSHPPVQGCKITSLWSQGYNMENTTSSNKPQEKEVRGTQALLTGNLRPWTRIRPGEYRAQTENRTVIQPKTGSRFRHGIPEANLGTDEQRKDETGLAAEILQEAHAEEHQKLSSSADHHLEPSIGCNSKPLKLRNGSEFKQTETHTGGNHDQLEAPIGGFLQQLETPSGSSVNWSQRLLLLRSSPHLRRLPRLGRKKKMGRRKM